MPTTERTTPTHENPKPNIDQNEHEEADQKNNYGGRSEKPDGDVNPAEDMHIDDDEKEKPACTDYHDAKNRKDND
ncbi:hypothetical protein [Hyphococcus lacteus]|uniref:Uncharacterized protein n=1 Tax=Hyphococcus lacteus TaxID=3143536 RepID=A0ABV3Z5L5_9PROT